MNVYFKMEGNSVIARLVNQIYLQSVIAENPGSSLPYRRSTYEAHNTCTSRNQGIIHVL